VFTTILNHKSITKYYSYHISIISPSSGALHTVSAPEKADESPALLADPAEHHEFSSSQKTSTQRNRWCTPNQNHKHIHIQK
jgi:hypothetical protein